MTTLRDAAELGARERCLAVVATLRGDSSIQASVVNAGVLEHPFGGGEVLGFVTYGQMKLRNLRARPQITATFRSGWSWAAVEGVAELIGPDDPRPGVDAERLRLLLREVFTAAGGTHDDWETYDREMAEQRRTVVLITPARVYSNRPTT
jgi:PPOX class probable F420-dependent enzyme